MSDGTSKQRNNRRINFQLSQKQSDICFPFLRQDVLIHLNSRTSFPPSYPSSRYCIGTSGSAMADVFSTSGSAHIQLSTRSPAQVVQHPYLPPSSAVVEGQVRSRGHSAARLPVPVGSLGLKPGGSRATRVGVPGHRGEGVP
eukprot:753178-Hanusia_phi.AAC.1